MDSNKIEDVTTVSDKEYIELFEMNNKKMCIYIEYLEGENIELKKKLQSFIDNIFEINIYGTSENIKNDLMKLMNIYQKYIDEEEPWKME